MVPALQLNIEQTWLCEGLLPIFLFALGEDSLYLHNHKMSQVRKTYSNKYELLLDT